MQRLTIFLIVSKNLHLDFICSHPAGGPGAGGGDGHPQVPVGVPLLDDVVGDGTAAVIQGRIPGDDHVVPVDLVKDDGALRWLRTV